MAGGMRRLTLRVGITMYPRDKYQSPERVTHDHNVLGLPTRCQDGSPGWSFVRGRNSGSSIKEYWYVRDEDVVDPDDFPDEEGYRS